MNRYLAIVAAAALTVGTATFSFADDTSTNTNTNNNPSAVDKAKEGTESTINKVDNGVRDTAAKVGIGSADRASANMSPHAAKIHNVLAETAEAAFTKGGFGDVVERLSSADRDRLNQNKDAYKSDDTTDGRVAELEKDWKDKYNQKFKIKDEDKTLNMSFASIDESAAGNNARTAAGTVAPEPAAPANAPANQPADNNAAANANRDTATVHIAASHGLPALDVPMVHEAGGWRIDIPDSVDSAKLKSNLQTALTDIGENKDKWPADVDEADRFATHRVLLAIMDKPATDTGAAGAAAPSSAAPAAPATPAEPAK